MATLSHRCRCCFFSLPQGAVACPACGASPRSLGVPGLTGARLSERYLVGGLCGGGALWCFDEETERRARIEPYAGNAQTAFFLRADALSRLSDSGAIVRVLDAFEEDGLAFRVTEELFARPLSACAAPLPAPALESLLGQAADALLVLHSVQQAHGAIGPDTLLLTESGRLRLFVPGEPAETQQKDDVRALGETLMTLRGPMRRGLYVVLRRVAAGRYESVFELRHALNAI